MKTWSVCNSDGFFTGQIISGSSVSALEANLPPTMRAIEGRHDRICQRVDLETGAVVDHQPAQPHEDYEWRAENPESVDRASQRWRWIKKPEVLEAEQRRAALLAQIKDKEERAHRRVREILAQEDPQLKSVEQELDLLRTELSSNRAR